MGWIDMKRICLFLRIVWRHFDSRDIPDPYRCDTRISFRTAWQVAKIMHP